ncbi:hypothetical protein K443DRAFT_517059 [Laccaria amethystina LaAM-08-1]|uniref:Uncharacterized protein n=1 Tax=Laccaria amethystina LaAM-08-1 TaxID=1095629 RepID=A0A0C9XXT4_9AGAR|nr:hypothetical protein K443DRAFT_517059 [Laccaria amethystina LaAM-08-1]
MPQVSCHRLRCTPDTPPISEPDPIFLRIPLTNSSRRSLRLPAHHRLGLAPRGWGLAMLKDGLSERMHEVNKE